jgi:hypothetical protein
LEGPELAFLFPIDFVGVGGDGLNNEKGQKCNGSKTASGALTDKR